MTFRRGQLKEVLGSEDRAAAAGSRGCARPHSTEHRVPDSSPGSSRSSFPGRTRDVQSRRPGPEPGPRPAAARTHPRRRRHPGGPNPSRGGPGRHRSPAPQAGPPPRGLRKPRLSWLRSESAWPLSSGRLPAASGRRTSPTGGGGAWAAGGGGGLGALRSPEIHPPPGRSAAAAADHFRGAGGAGRGRLGSNFLSVGGEEGVGGRGRRTIATSARAWRRPPAACRELAALPYGQPHPRLLAPGEVESSPGVRALPQASRRFPDFGVGAATSLSLSGDQEGVLGEGGKSGGRHLAFGGQLLLPRCPRVEATLSRGRGFPEWSWRRGSLRAESLEMVCSVACPGGRVSTVPWASCLTADPWRTRPRGWSVILY